ncbi:UNVERIFIED_CONTAM: hypothetical protein PYX00_001296 [Menopon gallinae]|uniref:Uncharacterized protein n=1 Tax=Menopon gallinae TaxID=328185 RepID=A0AAW2IC33_9NEOP
MAARPEALSYVICCVMVCRNRLCVLHFQYYTPCQRTFRDSRDWNDDVRETKEEERSNQPISFEEKLEVSEEKPNKMKQFCKKLRKSE